ncbi:hypothetical protein MSAN_00144100 [Mycena sanguinolenta]|uniref:Uncharacterized protein n=1 Tax=Mycena sanguinolenta TaxID=230812 RepID=A0A8H6ZDW6_9AGAR|nr:hypothetical protein MSAN_00144100 [Mycena sanguinolenta]
MNDQSYADPGFTHWSTSDPEFPIRASEMFSHSQQFSVTGKTFANITNHNYTTARSLPSDFRMIPLGDIDLRRQIRVDECTRVTHSQGQRALVTVAMYQGNNAEEEWRQDITKNMSMRFVAPQVRMGYTPQFSTTI